METLPEGHELTNAESLVSNLGPKVYLDSQRLHASISSSDPSDDLRQEGQHSIMPGYLLGPVDVS